LQLPLFSPLDSVDKTIDETNHGKEIKMRKALFYILFVTCVLLAINNVAFAITFINPDFEDGTNGWILDKDAGVVASFVTDTDSYSGARSAKVTLESAPGYCVLRNSQFPQVSTTGIYDINLYLKATGNLSYINFTLYKTINSNLVPNLIALHQQISNFNTSYQLFQLKDISLKAGEYICLRLGVSNSSPGGASTVQFDAISINKYSEDLNNAISLLRIIAKLDNSFDYDDINGDGKAGMEEVLFLLQNAAELRVEIFNPIGIWTGSFDGNYGTGQATNWELKSNQTTTGTIYYYPYVGGTTTININTTYILENNNISFTDTGTAVYYHPQIGTMYGTFTINVIGTFSSDTEASGSYQINFVDPSWTDDNGDWNATKN
jgi:hypothetical protein